ncbi:glucose 1-dehydrogenase [Streptomyces sp. NPDC000151]|uniref:SDR family NAD(P)-dependent oxidoreductase n=1 Tax=Streptomyces sp. NPDC000151 TaxID=3154244 RepID=UPI00332342D2
MDFTEKTASGRRSAIVTGAAHGIGLAITERLAASGTQVVLSDLDEAAGEAAAKSLRERGYSAVFHRADVSDAAEVTALVGAAEDAFGKVDILVNNAGVISTGDLDSVSVEQWNKVLAVDLTAVFLTTKSVSGGMRDRGWGRIVNVASVAAQVGGGLLGNSVYAAAKGGVLSLTKGTARELARHGVTCNAVCPSLTETPMTAGMPAERREAILSAIPVARGAQPDEIAAAVEFLASDDAAFITGATLNVDGGLVRA